MNREELKTRAKENLKGHYRIFLIVCFLSVILGAELSTELKIFNITNDEIISQITGRIVVKNDVSAADIKELMEEKEQEAEEIANKQRENENTNFKGLWKNNGVIAYVVNSLNPHSLLGLIASGLKSMYAVGSPAFSFVVILSLIGRFFVWLLIVQCFMVVSKRIFLEGRIYKKLPAQRFSFLFRRKAWLNASLVIFRTNIYTFLWAFTIIGCIKSYSYFLVPYIVAENPKIKAKDAIKLSRIMMDGHKWECFVLQISFILWNCLDYITLGLSAVFYTNPYKAATFAEYYVELRKEAKELKIENIDLLDDDYLYEYADDTMLNLAYSDAINCLTDDANFVDNRNWFSKFFADNFGVVLYKTKNDLKFENYQSRQISLRAYKYAVSKEMYPIYLNSSNDVERNIISSSNYHYNKIYTVWSIILMFFVFSFAGWFWEVSSYVIADDTFVNRGFMHGPWLPIYGIGAIAMLLLLKKLRKNPLAEFIGCVILCGVIEYSASVLLEVLYNGQKWWDYSDIFLNLNGRICAESLLIFGAVGLAVVYVVAPLLDSLISKIKLKIIVPICILLLVVFCADQVYSNSYTNSDKGINGYYSSKIVLEDK